MINLPDCSNIRLSVLIIIGQQEACSEGRQRQQLHQLAPASAGGGAAPA